MVDTSHAALDLITVWTDFGRRLAVVAGLCAALVSLIADCPLWVASARGAVTTLVMVLLAHGIARLLAWSRAGDREEAQARTAKPRERAAAEPKERR
jgi:hypothetical protein